ncbi:MAG: HicB family protein [Candidatus Riflebacteria bacterium HGW-Riflebacteria-2]|nr:MAG: HicB family protein [Candidatus Riflebacteria bacterium HGW-Riflebacteria-2]
MIRSYTLVYWSNEGLYVGKIREMPGIYGEAETLDKLVKNLQITYQQLMANQPEPKSLRNVQTMPIVLTSGERGKSAGKILHKVRCRS